MDGCGGCGLPVHVVSLAVLPQTESRVSSTEGHRAAVSVCHVCNATQSIPLPVATQTQRDFVKAKRLQRS